jgi:hypothetical protein
MLSFVQAIARQEGFGVAGDIPTRDNNPGDIIWGKFAQSQGATRDGRFARWTSAVDGFNAERELLVDDYVGLTVHDALNKWAPPIENDTSAYEANVCEWTGLTPETVLTVEMIG